MRKKEQSQVMVEKREQQQLPACFGNLFRKTPSGHEGSLDR